MKIKAVILKHRTTWLAIGLNLMIVILAIQSWDAETAELASALSVVNVVALLIAVPSLCLYLYAVVKPDQEV